MPESNKHYSCLILKCVEGTLTLAEKQDLENWVGASPVNKAIFDNLNTPGKIMAELKFQDEVAEIAARARKRLDKQFRKNA